jgi:uncharacterized membrane-anchored protein
MYTSFFRQLKPQSSHGFKCFAALLGLTVVLGLPCRGEQSSLAPMFASRQSKWVAGPASVSLGDFADIQVPQGYLFLADTNEARVLFQRNQDAFPSDFAGILAPASAAWSAVLRFTDVGYVKTSPDERIDPAGVLRAVKKKIQLEMQENNIKLEMQEAGRAGRMSRSVKSVIWELAPEFDAADHSLECAYRIEFQSDKVVNQSIRLLGRKGVLVVTAVRAVQSPTELISLKELMKGVTFKAGNDYADYQAGDKIASVGGISELITGKQDVPKGWFADLKNWFATMDRSTEHWMIGGVAACVVLVVVFIVTKEIRSLKLHESFPAGSDRRNGTKGKAQPVRRASGRQHSSQRKRAFDYQKFYAGMMMQASTRPYRGIDQSQDEATLEAEPVASPAEPPGTLAARGVTSEFIAQQKAFIEEQRRLMHQQAKLIEERSKLIEEKNQILAKQSEMIENHLL